MIYKDWEWEEFCLVAREKESEVENITIVDRNLEHLNIGYHVKLNDATIQLWHNVIIEDWVFFGWRVKVYTGYHDYTKFREERQKTILTNPVVIREGAWIASDAIILPGVTIGKNAVVGAGSVVTKDVPDNEVWAGTPAKFIKKI